MAKIKKSKAKATEPPVQPQQAAVKPGAGPAPVALHPSGHDVNAQSSIAHEEGGHDWPAPGHYASDDGGGGVEDDADAWGDGADASGEVWGAVSATAEEQSASQDWDDGGGWGAPTGGGWNAPPVNTSDWGQPPAPAGSGHGAYGMGRGNSKRGGAHHNTQLPTSAQTPAPTSLHPSAAAAQMPPSRGWGAPAPAHSEWARPQPAPAPSWGQPAAPRPPAAKPAWANWANEARKTVNNRPNPPPNPHSYHMESAAMGSGTRQELSNQQRSQILSSLLEAPGQHTKGYFPQSQPHQMPRERQQSTSSRSQQVFHPAQQGYMDPRVVAEQQGIWQSIQEARGQPQSHHARPQPVQYADSWTQWGKDGWAQRASTIPEEDEDYEEDEDWEEEEDDGWGQGYSSNQRVRFSPNVDYPRSPSSTSRSRAHEPTLAPGTSPPRQHSQQIWTPPAISSRTMKMATGTLSSGASTMHTTIFELLPPRNGVGENAFVESHREAIRPAERALFSRDRPSKERFRWGFNPDKDPRVRSLLRWVMAMSNGLATIGLQRFLETRERGALFANADYRVPGTGGHSAQPAFDWIPLSDLQNTLDSTLQSSVTLYDPAFQVIVFVFLLSPSGNSMAVWRRKLNVPDAVRDAQQHNILAVKAGLKRDYPVYVDELPVKPEEATPVKRKKVRFAFIRRMFGGGKKTAT